MEEMQIDSYLLCEIGIESVIPARFISYFAAYWLEKNIIPVGITA
ncbi:hypothetical protein VRK_23280 [Vibrio sp. MEBiC08052]|nr:hypothetical protein VRK_23280 [Vibrio sp. MEBiC08052]